MVKVNSQWGPPRGFGEQGNKAIYFRGTREQKSQTEGSRGTKAILGNREHRNQNFDFGEQGKMPIFFFQENKETSTWEGLHSNHTSLIILIYRTKTYKY